MNSNEIQVKPQLNIVQESQNKWNEIHKKLQQKNNISVKPYTLKELAEVYKVSVPTFKKMLALCQHKVGQQAGRYFTIRQVKYIFQYVDQPSIYNLTNLSAVYQVSIPTMRGWLEKFENELGERSSRNFSMRQLYIIITKLDIPSVEGKEHDDFISLLKLCA